MRREIVSIPLVQILADEQFNCRGKIIPLDIKELADDIKQKGRLIQPVTVCPIVESVRAGALKQAADEEQAERIRATQFLLVAGYRRYMAHRFLGWDEIEAIIDPEIEGEADARIVNLAENLHRKQLDIMQEAEAIRHLVDLELPETEIAARVGQSYGWVQVRRRLLELPVDVQAEAKAGAIRQKDIRDAWAILKKTGKKEAVYDFVKRIKDASARTDKKLTKTAKMTKEFANSCRYRNKQEIFAMMEHIRNHFGNGRMTRVLAWAAGAINDNELFESLKEYADQEGILYAKPETYRDEDSDS